MQYLRINAEAVVANKHSQLLHTILDLHFNATRLCVAKRVYQSFATDPIHVIANDGVQRSRLTLYNHSVVDLLLKTQLLLNPRKCLSQITQLVASRTKPSKRISAIFNNVPHQGKNAGNHRLHRRVLWQTIIGNVKLHGGTQETLQERVMQLLRNPRPFRKPLLKSHIHLVCQVAQSEPVQKEHSRPDNQYARRPKPPRLP